MIQHSEEGGIIVREILSIISWPTSEFVLSAGVMRVEDVYGISVKSAACCLYGAIILKQAAP